LQFSLITTRWTRPGGGRLRRIAILME